MTPESRIRALRSESAWSPMPEHLLFIQTKKGGNRKKNMPNLNVKDKQSELPHPPTGEEAETSDDTGEKGETRDTPIPISQPVPIQPIFPRDETEIINKCEECGMLFRTDAMLTYHKVAFCVGKPIDETMLTSRRLLPEDSMISNGDELGTTYGLINDVTDDGVVNASNVNVSRTKCPAWFPAKDGSVPKFAVKVVEPAADQEPAYVCMTQVGGQRVPATLRSPDKRATCCIKGQVFDTAEYEVLVDPGGQLAWIHCPVVGGIPRDAVKGGFDTDNLQYYVARGKAPDGTMCCGQYIPHKNKIYFAYDDTEYSASDFHFLYKKYSQDELPVLDKSAKKTTDNNE